jgi:hypothetical protein
MVYLRYSGITVFAVFVPQIPHTPLISADADFSINYSFFKSLGFVVKSNFPSYVQDWDPI